MGKTIRNTYVATVFKPNEHVRYESTSNSAVRGPVEILWTQAAGNTKVTMVFEGKPAGALRLVPQPMLTRQYEKEMVATLSRLKQLLENGAN